MSLYSQQSKDKPQHRIDPTPGFNDKPPDPAPLHTSYADTKPSAAAETSGPYQLQKMDTNNGSNTNDNATNDLHGTPTNDIRTNSNSFSTC